MMNPPLAYLITWTTYGTWLHGDARGWVESGEPGIQDVDHRRESVARSRMTGPCVVLTDDQCRIVESTIHQHCEIRRWELHALTVPGNHVHVVVAADVGPETVMVQLKAWCTRRLNEKCVEDATARQRWWTEHGSTKWINDESYLQNAIRNVLGHE